MDDIDRACDLEQMLRDAALRECSKDIPAGEPGECEQCGEMCKRLIGGVCARCRDRLGLP